MPVVVPVELQPIINADEQGLGSNAWKSFDTPESLLAGLERSPSRGRRVQECDRGDRIVAVPAETEVELGICIGRTFTSATQGDPVSSILQMLQTLTMTRARPLGD